MAELPHDRYHRRNLAMATALRGHTVAMFGVGAIGSFVAELLARNGVDLVLVDRDTLEVENLFRHTADPQYVGISKAVALARTLRALVPNEQTFRGIDVDIRSLSRTVLRDLLVAARASIVVGATGEDDIDLELNRACADLDLPFVVPGLYGANEDLLGEVQFVPWPVRHVRFACFECGRANVSGVDPLPGQPGPVDDGITIARLATSMVKAFLLPRSDEGRRLAERVARGATLTLVGPSGETTRHARPLPRPDCAGCSRARARHEVRQALDLLADPAPAAQPRPAPAQPAPASAPVATQAPAPARQRPRSAEPRRTRPRRAPGSAVAIALLLLAGGSIASWAASCNQLTKVNPSAKCDADTPFKAVAAIRTQSNLGSADPKAAINGAKRLIALDPKLDGWGRSAASALARLLVTYPKSASDIADVAKPLPGKERTKLANVFVDKKVVHALGPERAVSLGLKVARTPKLLDCQGSILTNLGEVGAALAWFEEALKKSKDMRIVAHWGYAAKLRGLELWDPSLAVSGHIALSEAVASLGEAYASRYAEALDWPVPIGGDA